MLESSWPREGVGVTEVQVASTRQVASLLGYSSPRWMSNVLTVALVAFAGWGVLRSLKLGGTLQSPDIAVLRSLTGGGPFIFQAAMILICPFLIRANQNVRALGETPENSTLRLVGTCLVPISNLILPYYALKDIWQCTSGRPGASPWWLPLWWWSVLLQAFGPTALLKSAPSLTWLAMVLAGPGTLVASVLTIVVVRRLALEQVDRYDRLPEKFALPRL